MNRRTQIDMVTWSRCHACSQFHLRKEREGERYGFHNALFTHARYQTAFIHSLIHETTNEASNRAKTDRSFPSSAGAKCVTGAKSSRDLETPIGPVVCRGSNCSQLVPAEFLLFLPVLVCTYTENTEWQACIHDTCDGVESRADYALRGAHAFLSSRLRDCRNWSRGDKWEMRFGLSLLFTPCPA